MRWITLLISLPLFACSSQGRDAERELDTISQASPMPAEVCAAEKKVAAGYLADHNAEKYAEWKSRADNYCLGVEIRANAGLAS